MHEKDTVAYWRNHCKEARRKVVRLEKRNKETYKALVDIITLPPQEFSVHNMFNIAEKAVLGNKGE